MVRIARRVQAARRSPTDPGYASPTSSNQAATTPNAPLDPTTRFGQPLLLDWTPKDQTPHNENVEIYTNAEEVELFLNDKSLGTQKLQADASPITYQVPFEPGSLKAIARNNSKIVARDELRTAGKPTRLLFSTGLTAANLTNQPIPENTPALTPDWNDIAYATATLVDASGTVIPDSETLIHFSITGPAKIIAVDNGNLLDHDPFQATARKLYEGHAIAILRATAPGGNMTITATTEGIPPATFTLHAAPAHPPTASRSF
jgi:beta-galactosidase